MTKLSYQPTRQIRYQGSVRGWSLRILHAAGFEGGLILIGMPISAWMLDITPLQALMVEVVFSLFFLPYTIGYNWLYDRLREKLVQHAEYRA